MHSTEINNKVLILIRQPKGKYDGSQTTLESHHNGYHGQCVTQCQRHVTPTLTHPRYKSRAELNVREKKEKKEEAKKGGKLIRNVYKDVFVLWAGIQGRKLENNERISLLTGYSGDVFVATTRQISCFLTDSLSFFLILSFC